MALKGDPILSHAIAWYHIAYRQHPTASHGAAWYRIYVLGNGIASFSSLPASGLVLRLLAPCALIVHRTHHHPMPAAAHPHHRMPAAQPTGMHSFGARRIFLPKFLFLKTNLEIIGPILRVAIRM